VYFIVSKFEKKNMTNNKETYDKLCTSLQGTLFLNKINIIAIFVKYNANQLLHIHSANK